METIDAIKALAIREFGREPDAVDENAPFDQLGIDSLGFLEFLFVLEDHFEVSIPQASVTGVNTLRQLAAVIDGLRANEATTPS